MAPAKRTKKKKVSRHKAPKTKMPNRAPRRTLVRWNDDHDKELLLWIVYCCNEQGLKIPFPRIAQCMGPSFTEGACIQHLAKIRTKMEEAGLHVPPAQKRGTVTRTSSSIYRPRPKDIADPVPRVRPDNPPPNRGRSLYDDELGVDDGDFDDGDPLPESTVKQLRGRKKAAVRQGSTARKTPVGIKHDSGDEDVEEHLPVLYGSDHEYGARTKEESAKEMKAQSLPKAEVKFGFNSHGAAMAQVQNQAALGYDSINAPGAANAAINNHSPDIKFESLDAAMANYINRNSPVRPRGGNGRQISGVDATDDGDGEFVPDTNKDRPSAKKNKGGRAKKKQKVEDKRKMVAEKRPVAAVDTGYDEVSQITGGDPAANNILHSNVYTVDRMTMPPPAFPILKSNIGADWNDSFISQPFAATNTSGFSSNAGNINDGFGSEISPTTATFGAGLGSGMNNHNNFNAYLMPSFDFGTTKPPSAASADNSRNPSFASAGSCSTVESQPASWFQQIDSQGYTNPKQASLALHETVQAPENDDTIQFGIFDSLIGEYTNDHEYDYGFVQPDLVGNNKFDAQSDGIPCVGDDDGLFIPETDHYQFIDDNVYDVVGQY